MGMSQCLWKLENEAILALQMRLCTCSLVIVDTTMEGIVTLDPPESNHGQLASAVLTSCRHSNWQS